MAEMKHMANKQMERHMNKAFGGKETASEEKAEGHGGGHHSFHVFHHPVHGTHSVHHHDGGTDHADHASPEEAMEHGKMAMGGHEMEEGGADHAMAPVGAEGEESWG